MLAAIGSYMETHVTDQLIEFPVLLKGGDYRGSFVIDREHLSPRSPEPDWIDMMNYSRLIDWICIFNVRSYKHAGVTKFCELID